MVCTAIRCALHALHAPRLLAGIVRKHARRNVGAHHLFKRDSEAVGAAGVQLAEAFDTDVTGSVVQRMPTY